jgi:hypothetical protein
MKITAMAYTGDGTKVVETSDHGMMSGVIRKVLGIIPKESIACNLLYIEFDAGFASSSKFGRDHREPSEARSSCRIWSRLVCCKGSDLWTSAVCHRELLFYGR